LTGPEGDFRSALEHVGHFKVRLAHHEIEIAPIFTTTGQSDDKRASVLDVTNRRSESHGNVHHIRVVAQHVRLLPGQLHVGIVLVAQTRTLGTRIVGRFEIEIPAAATPIKLNAGTNVSGEAEIAGQRFQKRFIEGGSFAFILFTVRIGEHMGIQNRSGFGFRFERLHLGLHGRDTVFVFLLHLFHLGLVLLLHLLHLGLQCGARVRDSNLTLRVIWTAGPRVQRLH
jgi:hypothetical protein